MSETSPSPAPPKTRPAVDRDRRYQQQVMVCLTYVAAVGMAVALTGWIVGDSAVRDRQLAALRAALTVDAPASPSPALAGQVVYARGRSVTGQVVADEEFGVTLSDKLFAYRRTEVWRSGRTAGWEDEDVTTYVATDARLGGWELDPAVLSAADPYRTLDLLLAGKDYPVPEGWFLRGAATAGHSHRLVDAAERNDDPDDNSDGDRRLSYRALPAGELSVVARVDPTGMRLVPLPVEDAALSLIGTGTQPPEALFAQAGALIDDDRSFAVVASFALAWLGYAFAAAWVRLAHWALALTLVPALASALTVGAAALAASTGSILLGLLAGGAVAGGLGKLLVRRALRLGLFG
ncbi:TMEM43 family protein [Azospirillum sp. SYSU D00513]|uniref:TMEM43 family protein n=1 Tax=Azospirillum sp. SYSU D00513 TaxID=2812561 RepID=UPI001A973651|nr:TMEM43 family protein [Azospirillum sp. SYSU D00513]